MILSLCGFVAFTTGCFVSSHVLLFVLLLFSVLFSTVVIRVLNRTENNRRRSETWSMCFSYIC